MRQADNDDVFQPDAVNTNIHPETPLQADQAAPGVLRQCKLMLGEKYAPFSFRLIPRQPKYPLLIDGEIRENYVAQEIKEYVDTRTGEIVLAKDVPKGEVAPTNRFGEQFLQRQAVFHGLRPEVLAFARFVLQFRDQRGGMTPGMDTLVRWYADLEGKRAPDVRRYVERLEAAGVCEGDCMGPRFMWFEQQALYSHYLGAAPVAVAKFYFMKRRRERDNEAQPRRDSELVEQECSKALELQRLAA
jgi:hypothetical protein